MSNNRTKLTPTIPRILYKYSSERGLAILETLDLKITPPNAFNDPFEFTPHIICSNPMARAVRMLRSNKYLKGIYEIMKGAGRFRGSFNDFKFRVKYHGPDAARELATLIPLSARLTQEGFLDEISTTEGLLCLSSQSDSILMWGHYCDCHKGIVIGFNSSNTVFDGVRAVDYVTERVLFDAAWENNDPRAKTYHHCIVFSKNDDWRYESEFRQIFKLAGLKQKPLEKGTMGFFLQLPPKSISKVIIGARSSPDFLKKVQAELSKPHFSHVKLSRAMLHESKYALTIDEI